MGLAKLVELVNQSITHYGQLVAKLIGFNVPILLELQRSILHERCFCPTILFDIHVFHGCCHRLTGAHRNRVLRYL